MSENIRYEELPEQARADFDATIADNLILKAEKDAAAKRKEHDEFLASFDTEKAEEEERWKIVRKSI